MPPRNRSQTPTHSTAINNTIGFLAGLLTTFASAPQIYKMWHSRSGDGLSYGMVVLTMLGVGMWIVYGIRARLLPVVVWNTFAFTMFLIMLGLKLFHCHDGVMQG